jgi:hypothetical protein
MRLTVLLMGLLLFGCDHGVYTRDGVTDGDSFYLAPNAFANDDPAFQSWVTYSLIKSTCQLEIGGQNPARANSFDCEFRSRQQLVDAWVEKTINNQYVIDRYLLSLENVRGAGFLAEYTSHYFGDSSWQLPDDLRMDEFQQWRRQHLRRHRSETRIIGSWNYGDKVDISH